MLDVAIYARVSTDEQAEHGYSLSAQIESCRKQAQQMNADSVAVYCDPAESSMTLDRPGLTAMRVAIAQGRHNCVVVWDQDRLSRDAVGSLVLRDEILSAGCQLIFLQGGATTASPDDLLLYGIKALMAQSERIKIRARTMMGRRRKAEMGIMPVKFRLYGYSHNTKSGRIEPVDAQARWVRQMFEWCARERISAWRIARRLAAADAPSPTGRGWHKESVARLLRNEAYTGTAYANKWDARDHYRKKPREEWIPISVPPIIPKEIWDAAQLTLTQNRAKAGRHVVHAALLRGLVHCGRCGKRMRTYISPATGHMPRYYCSPSAKFQPGIPADAVSRGQCKGCSVRMQRIDPLVWQWAEQFLLAPDRVLAFSRAGTSELEHWTEEVALLERALARCGETRRGVLRFYATHRITEEEADAQFARLRKDERALKRRLSEARNMLRSGPLPEDATARVHAIQEALSAAPIERRHQILRELVDHVEVWPDADYSLPPSLRFHLRVGGSVAAPLSPA